MGVLTPVGGYDHDTASFGMRSQLKSRCCRRSTICG